MMAALRLLERESGPVLIEDFVDDDPRAQPDPAWNPPFIHATVAGGSADSLAARLEAEILLLRGAYDRRVAQRGRSTVGLSGLPMGTTRPGCGAVRAASAAEQKVLPMASLNPAERKVRRTADSLSAHGSARTPPPKTGSVLAKPLYP